MLPRNLASAQDSQGGKNAHIHRQDCLHQTSLEVLAESHWAGRLSAFRAQSSLHKTGLEHAGSTGSPARGCSILEGHPLNNGQQACFRRTKLTFKFLKRIKKVKQSKWYFHITISIWMQNALDANLPVVCASCTVVHIME